MKPLSPNFSFDRYGLHARLVNEGDTDYILSLRTNKTLSKFIHPTSNDREKQLQWYRKYKVREAEGRDYYFIYEKDGKPVGLNRIYNVFEYYGTIGSWICSPGDPRASMATFFMLYDIIFEFMDLDITLFDVRRENNQVWQMNEAVGAQMVGESDELYFLTMNKKTYLANRDKFIKRLKL